MTVKQYFFVLICKVQVQFPFFAGTPAAHSLDSEGVFDLDDFASCIGDDIDVIDHAASTCSSFAPPRLGPAFRGVSSELVHPARNGQSRMRFDPASAWRSSDDHHHRLFGKMTSNPAA